MKVILVLMLAKYLSLRHIAINQFRYIFKTFIYFIIPILLISLQPDFGTSLIFIVIWFGLVFVSGISWRYIISFLTLGIGTFLLLWLFVFKPYQKSRIETFIQPLSDIRGAGYNAYQSTIAVGSGKFLGKGLGFGTQSRLKFLPEHETDFIFASFSEEWGFFGSILL